VANGLVGAVDQAMRTRLPPGDASTAQADRSCVPSGPLGDDVLARMSSSSSLVWWACNGEPTEAVSWSLGWGVMAGREDARSRGVLVTDSALAHKHRHQV
jgi:hypothetical protein